MSSGGARLSGLVEKLTAGALAGRGGDPEDVLRAALSAELDELLFAAGRVRRANFGRKAVCCSIASVSSGRCSEDCKFCAQSSSGPGGPAAFSAPDADALTSAARQARTHGARGFGLVSSGCRPGADELVRYAGWFRAVAREGVEPHASLGLLGEEEARALAGAGVCVYNHNL